MVLNIVLLSSATPGGGGLLLYFLFFLFLFLFLFLFFFLFLVFLVFLCFLFFLFLFFLCFVFLVAYRVWCMAEGAALETKRRRRPGDGEGRWRTLEDDAPATLGGPFQHPTERRWRTLQDPTRHAGHARARRDKMAAAAAAAAAATAARWTCRTSGLVVAGPRTAATTAYGASLRPVRTLRTSAARRQATEGGSKPASGAAAAEGAAAGKGGSGLTVSTGREGNTAVSTNVKKGRDRHGLCPGHRTTGRSPRGSSACLAPCGEQ